VPEIEKFTIRVSLPEESDRSELSRILQGWGQVTAFGRVVFSKTVTPEEALRFLTSLRSCSADYSLSIDEAGGRSIDPTRAFLFSTVEATKKPSIPPKEVNAPKRRFVSLKLAFATLFLVSLASVVFTLLGRDAAEAPASNVSLGLYEDRFDDNRFGWIEDETAEIDGGKYLVNNRGRENAVLVANQRFTGRNMVCEVDLLLIDGREGSFAGLAFRVRNPENFYFFGLSPDGRVAMVKREIGFWRRLLPGGGMRSGLIGPETGPDHRLRIAVKDFYIEFHLDGELLSVVRDESFEEGSLGFYVGEDLTAAFDELLLVFNEAGTFDFEESLE
jgi:hypothetical protein